MDKRDFLRDSGIVLESDLHNYGDVDRIKGAVADVLVKPRMSGMR